MTVAVTRAGEGWRPRVASATARALLSIVLAVALAEPSVAEVGDNPVLRWNQAALEAIATTRTTPPVAARALAILHTCIHEAWAAYDAAEPSPHGVSLRRPFPDGSWSERDGLIHAAAYSALSDLFPSQQVTRLDPLLRSVGLDPADESRDARTPAGLARAACWRVIELRHRDGSNQLGDLAPGAYSDYTGYSPVNSPQRISNPSRWQPLLVAGVLQVWQLAHWSRVTAFGLDSAAQFRPLVVFPGPVQPGSSDFVRQTRALIELSASLADREKVISEYWADGSGTATPPGHWNAIAQFVSRRDKHSTADDVDMFYVLANALLDTSIAAWDAKRSWDSVRPVTAIRFLMGNQKIAAWAGPGLGTQLIDCKDFRSYLPTPAFPSYVSGHSAFSAAAAEILRRATGSDRFGGSYVALPGSSLIERGLTPARPVTLVWATFTAAADEAGMSRRYGGIHFESDDLAGRALGRAVAGAVWARAKGVAR